MKVFAIRDEEDSMRKDLAYLIYYELDKRFYIELPEKADPWDTPLLLDSFVRRGIKTVNAYWSKLWVQQRIVPTDRQNLGQILKDNLLDEYDEFKLLTLANGRCAQDSYYITQINENSLFSLFSDRYEKKIEDVIPLKNSCLLVFFRNGKVKHCDVLKMKKDDRAFKPVLYSSELFNNVSIQTGGYGISWGENANIEDMFLYNSGKDVPLSLEDLGNFISNRVISTSEAAELLDCSRQNVNDLVVRDKLHPVKTEQKSKLFFKSEVLQRAWK